jgi:alkylation response protein AidB-like acyl-CoA dehydrogenase
VNKFISDSYSPFGHKAVLFEPAVEHNGTEEQKAKWLPLIYSGKILGTYAQTELGHGSFVRGLETTATFEKETDEFIINSPTASSTKFWPAGLAYSTTHAIVMAQLLIEGVSHGPHLFVAQIRSIEDGTPLPGVNMGDIGMKLGCVVLSLHKSHANKGKGTTKQTTALRRSILFALPARTCLQPMRSSHVTARIASRPYGPSFRTR